MLIRYLSGNPHKIAEAKLILGPLGVEVIPISMPINELQSDNVELIVRDKALRAFSRIGHRLFVEQTCLYIDALNGFPGGLTQPFWDALQAERFCELFGREGRQKLVAKTWIGYCNGRKIYHFQGEVHGTVPQKPRGDSPFQWDCVFVPDGYDETFAEMGERKNEISMRRAALNRFAEHLRDQTNA